MEFKIYVYLKPKTEEHLIYRTFTAAERACRIGGIIEEWSYTDISDRLVLTRSWIRDYPGELVESN